MRTGFLPLPLQRLQVLTAGMREKNAIASAGFCYLAAGLGFLEPFFHTLIKAARTNHGIKGTSILIVRWFLPAGTADTSSIASLMRI